MSDTENTQTPAETLTEAPAPQVQLSPNEMLVLMQSYLANAEASLTKLNEQVNTLSDQLTKLQQMRLMVSGQRELVKDMLARVTTTPEVAKGE